MFYLWLGPKPSVSDITGRGRCLNASTRSFKNTSAYLKLWVLKLHWLIQPSIVQTFSPLLLVYKKDHIVCHH